MNPPSSLERFQAIETRISMACERAGRNRDEVTLVGVTKRKSVEVCREALRNGIVHLGENYVQEWRLKAEAMATELPSPLWHFIGRLQSNKAKHLIRHDVLIHTVDRLSLLRALEKEGAQANTKVSILLQINVGKEPQKGGCLPQELESLAESVSTLKHVQLRGLMAIPPLSQEPRETRRYFKQLADQSEWLRSQTDLFSDASELSMGMSSDFEVAIEEGATLVRVGSALFGARD